MFKAAVRELSPAPLDLTEIPHGVTAVFSPRPDTSLLDSYAELLDSAGRQACITLAFGIASTFKEVLKDNTSASHLVFMLLEKRDRPSGNNPAEFVRINASNNVYQAWGSFLRDPVYQWVAETSALQLGLNRHVSFIHSKFMLIDPLSADPIIVTGSANFSADSTKRPPGCRHLPHRVQPVVQSLLLPQCHRSTPAPTTTRSGKPVPGRKCRLAGSPALSPVSASGGAGRAE